MSKTIWQGMIATALAVLLAATIASAQSMQQPSPGQGMMGQGMEGGMMCPMMGGGMGQGMMMSSPEMQAEMMMLHGEMMQKMGKLLQERGRALKEKKK